MRITICLSLAALLVVLLAGCADASISAVTPLPRDVAVLPTSSPFPTLVAAGPTLSGFAVLAATARQSTREAAPPTPTPLSTQLALGEARAIAAATDAAIQPTPRTPVKFADGLVSISFDEFYDGFDLRTGLVLSDKLVSLDGRQVTLDGYMAPPLKPDLDYFVLTRIRLAICPFCSTAADWPDDIALIYMSNETTTATEFPIRVFGRMEVGASVDQETGMVSMVRIYADRVEVLR